MGSLTYPRKSKQNKFLYLIGRRTNNITEGGEGKVPILDLFLVIYDFEEEEEAFLSSFFNVLISFCSPSPQETSYRQLAS